MDLEGFWPLSLQDQFVNHLAQLQPGLTDRLVQIIQDQFKPVEIRLKPAKPF